MTRYDFQNARWVILSINTWSLESLFWKKIHVNWGKAMCDLQEVTQVTLNNVHTD